MLAIAAIAITPHVAGAGESRAEAAQMLERLRNEAAVQWRSMARKLSHCEFEYAIVETERNGSMATKRTKRVSGYVADKCFLFTETIVSTAQVSVYGRNERYEFALSRSGDAPWTVTWQSARQDDDTPVGSAYAYLGGMLHLPWSISAIPLEQLVNHPRFSVRAVRPRDNGSVQVDFTIATADPLEDELQGLSSGFLVLDPSRRWAVMQYRAQYANKISSSAKLVYGKFGPPEVSQVRFELRTKPERTSQFAIDVGKYDWTADRNPEITLTAFGLPEYQDPTNRRRWLRLVNIGIILVVVGFILRRRRQETIATG
jgi:hypothetical protein